MNKKSKASKKTRAKVDLFNLWSMNPSHLSGKRVDKLLKKADDTELLTLVNNFNQAYLELDKHFTVTILPQIIPYTDDDSDA